MAPIAIGPSPGVSCEIAGDAASARGMGVPAHRLDGQPNTVQECRRRGADTPEDRLVYNKSNGNLYVDVDGKGGAAAVLFAVIDNRASLDHHDFAIV